MSRELLNGPSDAKGRVLLRQEGLKYRPVEDGVFVLRCENGSLLEVVFNDNSITVRSVPGCLLIRPVCGNVVDIGGGH